VEHVEIVILLALIEYMVLGFLVARARAKYGVKAPAITGPEAFDRTFRVHQNTLEALIVFLPALWLFGIYVSASVAAGLGLLWIIGRAMYAWGYLAAAEKRGPGAGICGIVQMVLVLGALIGVIRSMF
jgi:glutathione S-transferase